MIRIAAETCASTQRRNSTCRYCSLHTVQLHRHMKWILIYRQVIKSRSAEREGSVSAAPVASWIGRQSSALAPGLSQPCRFPAQAALAPGAELSCPSRLCLSSGSSTSLQLDKSSATSSEIAGGFFGFFLFFWWEMFVNVINIRHGFAEGLTYGMPS